MTEINWEKEEIEKKQKKISALSSFLSLSLGKKKEGRELNDRFDSVHRQPPLARVFVPVLVVTWFVQDRDAHFSILVN